MGRFLGFIISTIFSCIMVCLSESSDSEVGAKSESWAEVRGGGFGKVFGLRIVGTEVGFSINSGINKGGQD